MVDFNDMVGRPGAHSTGPLQVAGRHRHGRTWPAVIMIGKALAAPHWTEVEIRIEMTPEEARKVAAAMLQMASGVE